eukprot:TRINITY_DN4846_c0_g1_i1.p1 TRINITY_DN4846_c0_g1~~TRINITY_DN4846_c0_g1_i1.p1  ORF type:complete len:341 (-),score=-24.05 TRINITY_DN4846_c0_g1_i1:78-1046(-)
MFKMQLKYKHQHRNIHLDSTTQGTQPMLKNEPDMQSIKISKFLISRDDTSHIFPTNSVKILSVLRYLVHGSKQNINVSKTNYILRYTRLTRVNCSFIISNKTYPTHQTKQINTTLLPTPITPILNNSKLFLNLTQILALLSKLMLQPTFQSQAKFGNSTQITLNTIIGTKFKKIDIVMNFKGNWLNNNTKQTAAAKARLSCTNIYHDSKDLVLHYYFYQNKQQSLQKTQTFVIQNILRINIYILQQLVWVYKNYILKQKFYLCITNQQSLHKILYQNKGFQSIYINTCMKITKKLQILEHVKHYTQQYIQNINIKLYFLYSF